MIDIKNRKDLLTVSLEERVLYGNELFTVAKVSSEETISEDGNGNKVDALVVYLKSDSGKILLVGETNCGFWIDEKMKENYAY